MKTMLVPREPTEAMMQAAYEDWNNHAGAGKSRSKAQAMRDQWRAMFDVAAVPADPMSAAARTQIVQPSEGQARPEGTGGPAGTAATPAEPKLISRQCLKHDCGSTWTVSGPDIPLPCPVCGWPHSKKISAAPEVAQGDAELCERLREIDAAIDRLALSAKFSGRTFNTSAESLKSYEDAKLQEDELRTLFREVMAERDCLVIDYQNQYQRAERAEAAAESYRKDAERYCWLRPHFRAMSLDMGSQHRGWHCGSAVGHLRGPTLDAAIDAALAAAKPSSKQGE